MGMGAARPIACVNRAQRLSTLRQHGTGAMTIMRVGWKGLAAALILVAGPAWAGDISIEEPFARASPGLAQAGAAFMTLRNAGQTPDRLIKAEAPVSERTELHTVTRDGDVLRMRAVEAIDIPAGGEAQLKPGGYHVMFLGLKEPLKEGASVPLTLTFEKAGVVRVEVPVKAAGAGAPTAPGTMPNMPHGGHPPATK